MTYTHPILEEGYIIIMNIHRLDGIIGKNNLEL
jgi:hypothetical protein